MQIVLDIGINSINIDTGGTMVAVDVPKGSIKDGLIYDTEGVLKALKAVIEKSKTQSKTCTIVLSSVLAQYKEITVPQVPKRKLLQVIRGQLGSALDGNSNIFIDYLMYNELRDGKPLLKAIILRRELVSQYLGLAEKLELKCTCVDLRFNVLRKQVAQLKLPHKAYIVIEMAGNEAELSLFEGEHVFTTSLQLGQDDSALMDWGITYVNINKSIGQQAQTIAEKLNSLVQFQLSSNRNAPVEAIYYEGHHSALDDLIQSTQRLAGRTISMLPSVDDGYIRQKAIDRALEG